MASVLKSAVKHPNSVPSSVAAVLKLTLAYDDASEANLLDRLQKQSVAISIFVSSDASNQTWNSGPESSDHQEASELRKGDRPNLNHLFSPDFELNFTVFPQMKLLVDKSKLLSKMKLPILCKPG